MKTLDARGATLCHARLQNMFSGEPRPCSSECLQQLLKSCLMQQQQQQVWLWLQGRELATAPPAGEELLARRVYFEWLAEA